MSEKTRSEGEKGVEDIMLGILTRTNSPEDLAKTHKQILSLIEKEKKVYALEVVEKIKKEIFCNGLWEERITTDLYDSYMFEVCGKPIKIVERGE